MKHYILVLGALSSLVSTHSLHAEVKITEGSHPQHGKTLTIENDYIARTIMTKGKIRTLSITNKLDGKTLIPSQSQSFLITLADGSKISSDRCQVTAVEHSPQSGIQIDFSYRRDTPFSATLTYSLVDGEFYTRKQITLTPDKKDLKIDQLNLEPHTLAEIYQPYQTRQLFAHGVDKWRTGLGQPLYTKTTTGSFWGVEFPAADNHVVNGNITCGYTLNKTLTAGEKYTSYKSVIGVSDNPAFIQDAFYDYIDRTRVRPLRLQTQYNSWFDFSNKVDAKGFAESVKIINAELNTKRGVPPLQAYVIDDGWQDTGKDWSKKAWVTNKKFDPAFKDSFQVVKKAKSDLGLWMSPGCLFGSTGAIGRMRNSGVNTLAPWVDMTDPIYTQRLEERMLELVQQGVTYYKLDGIFGHRNVRNFKIPGYKGAEKELNHSKFDPFKIAYLAAGSERLMQIFKKMHEANPDVYIVISNGSWLSPWWLQHIDAVWMINAGDAASGAGRTGELRYRDGVYHSIVSKDATQYPIHSIFNHEPKKVASKETKEVFRDYLYMNMSRGTGFIELYIETKKLKAYDWDVMAEGLLWAHEVFPTFKRSRMHGGSPNKNQVYGFTAWTPQSGYISIHNPSGKEQSYTVTLDRAFGLHSKAKGQKYHLSSPIAKSLKGLKKNYAYGDTITINLKPKEIRILNFDTKVRDWSQLKALQTRTKEDYVPEKK